MRLSLGRLGSILAATVLAGAFLQPIKGSGVNPSQPSQKVAIEDPLVHPPLVVAYYLDNDPNALIALLTQGYRLSWIITTNLSFVDGTGSLQGEPEPEVLEVAHNLGQEVHFRITNFVAGDFSREVAHTVLTHPVSRSHALASILYVLDKYNYDGVNIDLENVAPGDRAALTRFTTDLSTAIRSRGKTLSVAVPPKLKDQLNNDWSGAFDYAALGRATDTVILMAYDQHWSTSAPGPVAGLPWVDAVVRFAEREVGPHKLLLGVPFYGYDWPKRGWGKGVSMRDAVDHAAQVGAPIRWDDEDGVPYYRTTARTVYFEDARSIERKLDVATRYRLAGVAAWRLGHELPEVWDVITTYLANSRAGTRNGTDFRCAFPLAPRVTKPDPVDQVATLWRLQHALNERLSPATSFDLGPNRTPAHSCSERKAPLVSALSTRVP